jgi:two-component system sensor kinase FixL
LALDLNAVVDEAIALVQRELTGQQVAIQLELAAALPTVCGDRVQLMQVLINLIMNAMQAMHDCAPGQAVLTLQTARDAHGGACCSVADSGPGVAAGHLPRLFEAFFSTKADGMGMGLPICRSIIDNHGGRLWASSQPGAGATFSFALPAMDGDCP